MWLRSSAGKNDVSRLRRSDRDDGAGADGEMMRVHCLVERGGGFPLVKRQMKSDGKIGDGESSATVGRFA